MKTIRPSSTALKHLSSTFKPSTLPRPAFTHPLNHQRVQSFVSNPFSSAPQTITATRTLPYPHGLIYNIISDVSSYQQFLPYVRESKVTKQSAADANGKTWPEEASLTIGFSDDVSEAFHSRVYCVPETIVEAVSGATDTSLAADSIAHHSARPDSDAARNATVLSHLKTTWMLRPFPYKPPPPSAVHPETTHENHKQSNDMRVQPRTEVNLSIEFTFANTVYAAMSSAVAPKVAEKMIEAFESRVKAVVEGPAAVGGRTGRMEGVLRPRGESP